MSGKTPMHPWQPAETAPKDGTLIDVMFDIQTAEQGMAEFYAPGCTLNPVKYEPIIENVAYVNGSFKPIFDDAGSASAAELKGGWGNAHGSIGYGILSVTITAWRPAAHPVGADSEIETQLQAGAKL